MNTNIKKTILNVICTGMLLASANADTAWQQELTRLFGRVDPFFGVNADTEEPALLEASAFKDLPVDYYLFFDFGNNLVNGAVGPRGTIQRAMIFTGIKRNPNVRPAGVWYSYELLNICRSDRFALRTAGRPVYIDQKGLKQQTRLVDGTFPLTTVQIGDLKVRQLVMAPYSNGTAVRGLLVGFYIETERAEPVQAELILPPDRDGWGPTGKLAKWDGPMPEELPVLQKKGKKTNPLKKSGRGEFVLMGGLEKSRAGDTLSFAVSKGSPVWIPVLLVMDEDADRIAALRAEAQKLDSRKLVRDTARYFSQRIGKWELNDLPSPLASMTRRLACLQMATVLRARDGSPVGSSWGSATSEPTRWGGGQRGAVWMHDTFYNYLSAGLFDPMLMLDGVKLYMTRSVPEYPSLYHDFKGEKFTRPHSIGNAVVPIVLAGRYYDLNGNGEALKELRQATPDGKKILGLDEVMITLLDNILASRDNPDSPMLFESVFLSDPRVHGKYHTGSNILTWYAFKSAARLLEEVFDTPDKARQYRAVAEQMKRDIPQYCTVMQQGKRIYAEGYEAGEMDVAGEESGTVIASALGFCEVDDPAMLGRFQFACTPDNPSWDVPNGGIAWQNRCITFPGYVTAFAAAANDEELISKADKLLSMTDLDGGWWWWPIKLGQTDVQRAWVGKCGWANGVYLAHFFDKIIGLNWDAPTRNLTLRPFVAWERFDYSDLKFGSLEMDLSYENTAVGAKLVLKHNQAQLDSLKVVFRAPLGTRQAFLIDGPESGSLKKGRDYFGKPTWELTCRDINAAPLNIQVDWK